VLIPVETTLIGAWTLEDASVVGDATTKRIEALVSNLLVELQRSTDGWSTLYKDPNDGRGGAYIRKAIFKAADRPRLSI
jgi:hypothetical protein